MQLRIGGIPLGRQTRVDHRIGKAVFAVQQGLPNQPIDERAAVGRIENFLECVLGPQLARAGGDGDEIEVVITEDNARVVAELRDVAQDSQGLWAAVDEIANEPQAIAAAPEVYEIQQRLELVEATLHVADGIGGHELP